MKLFSNLLKLSLAPFAVVFGLSEVPLGIRKVSETQIHLIHFVVEEFCLNFSRKVFFVGFDVLLLSTELQTEPLVIQCNLLYYFR